MATKSPRTVVERTAAPTDAAVETLDVRDLGPPAPLKNTLERLVFLDDDTVLVQYNDRAPQHLYPKLDDRGYDYETVEGDDATVTVIWHQ
jgi:hypothetical protein